MLMKPQIVMGLHSNDITVRDYRLVPVPQDRGDVCLQFAVIVSRDTSRWPWLVGTCAAAARQTSWLQMGMALR